MKRSMLTFDLIEIDLEKALVQRQCPLCGQTFTVESLFAASLPGREVLVCDACVARHNREALGRLNTAREELRVSNPVELILEERKHFRTLAERRGELLAARSEPDEGANLQAEKKALRQDLNEARERIRTLEAELRLERAEGAMYRAWCRNGIRVDLGHGRDDDLEMHLDDLLFLTHPDKHGGDDERACRVTRWLIERRNASRARQQ